MTLTVVLTVSLASNPTKAMTLYNTLKTTTFGSSNHVHKVSFNKNVSNFQRLTQSKFLCELFELDELALRSSSCFFEVTHERLSRVFFFLLTETELNSLVSIGFFGFYLRYYTRTSFNNRTRQSLPVRIVHACHSDFFSY